MYGGMYKVARVQLCLCSNLETSESNTHAYVRKGINVHACMDASQCVYTCLYTQHGDIN